MHMAASLSSWHHSSPLWIPLPDPGSPHLLLRGVCNVSPSLRDYLILPPHCLPNQQAASLPRLSLWPMTPSKKLEKQRITNQLSSVFNLFLHEMPPTSLWVYWHPAIERIKSLAPTSLPGGRRAADSLRSLLTAKPDSWNYSEYTAWLSDAGCFLCFCKSTTNDVAAWSVSA